MSGPTATQGQGPRQDANGSRTMTITPTRDVEVGASSASPPSSRAESPSSVGVLRLRGGPVRRQRVMWTSDTVDNEGMGKKKSKICCIYHKPKRFDESSSESDSCSSDDENGSCCGDAHSHGTAQAQRACPAPSTEVEQQSSESESDGGGGDGRARPARRPRRRLHKHSDPKPKANKYDVQPKSKGDGP